MDVSAVVLNKLLLEKNLDIWAKLKLTYLDSAYVSLYSAIARHYERFTALPTIEELDLELRDGSAKSSLAAVKLIDEPNIDSEVAFQALLDQYTQNQAVEMLDKFVDKLPIYNTEEIKDNLSAIVLSLDDKTLSSENTYNMADMLLFQSEEDISKTRVYLGLNNQFDAMLGGVALEEYILVGGERGSGKSITASNVACNQYEMGNSVVYFTIEMLAKEISERNFAILADVPYMKLKNGQLNKEEYLKVVKARAEMFLDSEDLVEQYKIHNNRFKFEKDLIKTKKLKPDNQIILVDDRRLTIPTIDLHLGRLKARFGDKLKVAVVDYINQIKVDGKQYDWSVQIEISTALKELARKHKMVMFSPYQIDNSGEARFAKGILDSADISLILKAHDKESGAISFKTTKIRGGPPGDFTCPINWETLKIDPSSIEPPSKKEKTNDKMKGKKVDDSSADIPPWD